MSDNSEPSSHATSGLSGPAGSGTLVEPARLLGRERECAELDQLLERARAGRSGSLVVRGEAGMGKTALLSYMADRGEGMTILRATGVEVEYDLAFAGLHALLWPVIDGLSELPEPQRDALAAALGLAAGSGGDRFRISAGVLSLLAATAEASPVLCLVEDVQWLDLPSASALAFAARRLVAERVVIVFAAREGENRRFVESGLPEMMLEPLDRESAADLLGRSSPRAVPRVRQRLLTEARGNPLALLELPAALSDAQLAGRASLPEALPLTARLRSAFTQQLKRLPEASQAALMIASAENAGELGVIHAALDGVHLADGALDPAEEAGLIRMHDGTLVFRHPLLRSAIYESATLARRQRAHAALADALAREQRSDRALWHRAMATDGPDEQLAEALEASARQSGQRAGHASAASGFERAAALSETEAARVSRLVMAAEAAWGAGQADRARSLIDRSLPTAGEAARVRLLYLGGVIEGRHGWLARGVTTLRQAAALSDDPSLRLQMLREAGAMAIYAGDYEQVIAIGEDAAEVSPKSDVDCYIKAAVRAYAADLSADQERGAALAAEAIELAELIDDPMCLISAAATAARQRMAADGLRYATRAAAIARERALVSTLPFALQAQARALIGASRFDLAYAAAEEGWRLALDVQQPWAASLNLAYLARIDALRGAEQLASDRVSELQALVATSGASALTCSVAMTMGLLELERGRPSQALDHLMVVVSTVRPESNPLFVLGLPDAVEAAVRADRLDDVLGDFERFEAWVTEFPTPARVALLARCRALVDESAAERNFEQAVGLAEALSPFDRARSEMLYGEWLRRHRRRVDARAHLRAALLAFGQLGLPPWEERARSELRATGETARKRDPSTRDRLTAQELQIARLVAAGMSNPEVAGQLFLSPRTIDYHLRKVFTKLEITSRTELAAVDLGDSLAA
jgi:DNA-binding CsgD family transcriptional regulator